MKKVRFGLPLVAVAAVALAACASGSGGGGEEEGNPPRDNSHTRSAELFLTQAQTLGDPARYNDAIDAANNSILEEPTNPRGYFQAGRAQLGLEDYVAADTLFDKTLELYPPYAEEVRMERENAWIGMFNRSIDPMNAGNPEEGIRLLELAEVIFPDQRPEALINLGVGYSNMGRNEEAIVAFGEALEIIRGPRSESMDSAMVAGWVEQESSVAFNRAQLLSQTERYDEAAAEYETYLASNPGDISALSNLAAVMSSSGRPDSAQAIYDHLLDQEGLEPRDFFNIGVGLYSADVFDRAADAFRQVAEVGPENRDAVYNYAQSLYEDEQWETLLDVGRDLVELDGYNSNSYAILARALINTGDEQEAVRVLQAGEDLAFNLENSVLQPRSAGGGSVTAELINKTLEAGSEVNVRVHFISDDGVAISFVDVRVDVPEPDVVQSFRADLTSDEDILGFYFEVINPS